MTAEQRRRASEREERLAIDEALFHRRDDELLELVAEVIVAYSSRSRSRLRRAIYRLQDLIEP